ncbi:hypothetical protein [Limnohabitans sp.]|uniref:hypothetical protein n=1 Tax=Limnohabitans sp. TaxID=1907725 RepID=UPI00286F4E8C|nr:hypothetical protein [Limnohabitans sp.]
MPQELIPGVEFNFGGERVYTIPPLTLGALQRLQHKLSELSAMSALDPQAISIITEATHVALLRNYPNMTVDELSELLDVSQLGDVLSALLDVSGLQRKAQAEAKNQVAQPVQTSALTGLPSSPASA